MPEGDRVGSAYVDIHVNAGPGEAELAAFKAKVDRDFAELERKKAEATLQLKSTEFDAKIDKAKTELDNLEHRKARVGVSLDTAKFDAEIAEAKAEIKALGREKAKVRLDLAQLRDANRETRLLSKARELDERAALGQAKAEQRISQARERTAREIQRTGQIEARARAQNAKYDAERATNAIKTRAELARLSDSYEKLRGRQIGLEKSSRRVFSPRSLAQAESEARKLERVASEADYVKHRIEQLGGSVAHLDPQISRNTSLLDRWLSKLGDTSIRLGPITTSFKGLALGLGLLGPILFELGGGVTALAGTIGMGLVGAATVGAGALTGFAAAALGVGMVLKPMVGEFEEVHKALEKVSKAERKYGKGSEQAKTAQEQLNNTIKGVSPAARKSFQDYVKLKSAFEERTGGAKKALFSGFESSLKTARALLPGFASETVKTSQVAAKAWSGWMKSLRSSEAKQILGSIMSDFRASIPGLASGLGSLVAMLGRLAAAGSHFLPGLSNGFAEWANNLEHAVGGGQQLQSDVGNMVTQMRDLGHLTQDTGSLLVHIFSAGADSGNGMVKSLDKVISRWDTWTQSARGKSGLKEFFGDSKTATEDFMSSLSHMTRLLFEFSRATAPVANGLLKVITFIGDIVTAADDIVGVKQVFQGLGIILAGLFVASKVLSYADAIKTVATRLMEVPAAVSAWVAGEQAITASAAEATVAMEAETAAAAEAEAAAAGMGLKLGASGAALEETAGSAGVLAAALSPEVLIPVGVFAGIAALTLALRGSSRTIQDVEADFRKAGHEMNSSLEDSSKSIDKYVSAQQRNAAATHTTADARARLIKLQRENAPVGKITQAVEDLAAAEQRQAQAAHRTGVVNKEQIRSQKSILSAAQERVKAAKEEIHSLKLRVKSEEEAQKNLAGGGEVDATRKNLAKSERDLAAAVRDVTRAREQNTAAAVPYERQQKGLKAINDQTEHSLRRLSTTIGAAATKKIGNFVDPGDVHRVAELGNKLTKLGRGGQVKNIAVKSQGADQTIAKLQKLQHQTNRVEAARATIKVGANDTQAQARLKRVAALSQRIAGTKQTVHILANADSAEQAIHRLRAHLIGIAKQKYRAELTALDKTMTPREQAEHGMRQVVNQKYSARIEAVDDATAKAKGAGDAAKKAGQVHARIQITATNAQALAAISSVNSSLATLHDKTVNVNVVTHKSGGFSGGPAAAYYNNFATGGINKRELQRANELAVIRPTGPSRRINRPTMLVGEQAPQHPEYVIATNPAFRADNERYLDQAANDLGYEVVPAYAKGKGKKSKGKGGGSGGSSGGGSQNNTAKTLANHPPKPKHRSHKIAKVEKWGPVADYNQTETDAQIKEELYSQLYDHDEAEIKAGRMDNWEFARMRALLSAQTADYRHLGNLVPDIRDKVNHELGRIHRQVDGKGPYSKPVIRDLNHKIGVEKSKLGKLKKGKNESDASYRKRKRPYEQSITQMETEKKRLEKERERLIEIRTEAKQELSEVTGARKLVENKTNMESSEDELQYIEDVESGVVEAPYAESEESWKPSAAMESAKADLIRAELEHNTAAEEGARHHMLEIAEQEYNAALATPGVADDIAAGEQLKQLREDAENNGGRATLGEQTASYNQAREDLYKNFASNIFGDLVPTARGASAIGASGGSPSYVPSAMTALAAATPSLHDSTMTAATGKIEVVNNFAAPPPDPHTWTKQQEFELGALA